MIDLWLSKDPIGISGGLNQYVAFGNNPVMFVDPFGLVNWRLVGRGTLGFFVNSAAAVGGAIVAATGVGAVPGGIVAVTGAYGAGASLGNIVNGFMDRDEGGPTGIADATVQTGMLVGGVDPNSRVYRNVSYGAQAVDIVVPLVASGRIDYSRLPPIPLTPTGAIKYVPMDPAKASALVNIGVHGNAALTAYDAISSAADEYKREKCP